MKHFIFLLIFLTSALFGDVQLIKKENNDSNITLLVIGGIHGNEPGGYFAPAILAQHYTITSKNLWIVPNLNKASILANRRGIHGDMNRKFSFIKKGDKDNAIVSEIKKIILAPQVSLVLNLHDGHGFYRPKSQSSIFNPNAWGQTCVIDQSELKTQHTFGNLNTIATQVQTNVNKRLIKKHHTFNVKNTHTKYKDEAMRLSLTYFAVTHNKPAFAIETSKNLSTLTQKVFYQLLAIEEYMKIMKIGFKRDFKLNAQELQKIIQNYGTLTINGNIFFNLSNIKSNLRFIPIKSKDNEFAFSHPLGAIKKQSKNYVVYIGNKKIATLHPQYFSMYEGCPKEYEVQIDGKKVFVKKASYFDVKDDFMLVPNKDYRVNIIGFSKKGKKDESGLKISKEDLSSRYSLDKSHRDYRVEIYHKKQFCTMLVAHFK